MSQSTSKKKRSPVRRKDPMMTFLLNKDLLSRFQKYCAGRGITMSEMVRLMIYEKVYGEQHNESNDLL